jgi:tetratricopeptide (TPR) repeat protein
MRTRVLLSLLAAGFLLPQAGIADEIVFTNGQRRQGRVEAVEGSADRVALITATGRIEIPRDRIAEIIETDDATDFAILGDQFLARGNVQNAMAMFQRAISYDANNEAARAGLEKARSRMAEHQVETQKTQQRSLDNNLQRARELIESNEHAEAERLLQQLLDSNPTPQRREETLLAQRDLYLSWALFRRDRLDNAGAERHFREVLRLDPNNRAAYDGLLDVLKDSSDPAARLEVLRSVQIRLQENPTNIEMNRQAADILWSLNRRDEAIEYMLRMVDWSSFNALGYNTRLESAMQRRAQDQALAGQIDDAIATFEQLVAVMPNTDARPLFQLRFEQKLQSLAADDFDARAALLGDLEAQGLMDFALREANAILAESPTNTGALDFVRRRAERDLSDAQEAFNTGQFLLASRTAEQFAANPDNRRFPDMMQVASDIMARSQIEAERQARQSREQARQIASLGDQYLAEARRNADMMRSADINQRTTGLSFRSEATRFAQRAINAYQTALQIDPSLGDMASGGDLNSRIQDAQRILNTMTQPAIQMPMMRRSSTTR